METKRATALSRRARLKQLGASVLDRLRTPKEPAGPFRVSFHEEGRSQVIEVMAESGLSLLEIARKAGVDISSFCGGGCSCGTCRVGVLQGELSRQRPQESMVLGESQVRRGDRLACQARVVGPVSVRVRRFG